MRLPFLEPPVEAMTQSFDIMYASEINLMRDITPHQRFGCNPVLCRALNRITEKPMAQRPVAHLLNREQMLRPLHLPRATVSRPFWVEVGFDFGRPVVSCW